MRKLRQLLIILLLISFVIILFFSDKTLRFLNKDKIWAHKVNSIEKLKKTSRKYKGVELDVVYDVESNSFKVSHPPEKSGTLTLTEYFNSNSIDTTCFFWLDFKNLNTENVKQSYNKLDSLIESINIEKRNFIIESVNPQFLKFFTEKGFVSSYYLPVDLYKLESKKLELVLNRIENNINEHENSYISFDYKDYQIIKSKFPKYKKLTWYTSYTKINKIKARLLLFEILLDENVDVLLVPSDY